MPKVALLIFNDINYGAPYFDMDIREAPLADILSIVQPTSMQSRSRFSGLGDLLKVGRISSGTVTEWYVSNGSLKWSMSDTQSAYREIDDALRKYGVEFYHIVYFTDDPPGWGVPRVTLRNHLITKAPRIAR